jgi:hypothetical protein
MGLVEITGTATAPQTIPAGITGDPCYYYRATAWELRQSGNSRQWKQVANESLYVPFFVKDATGKVLVDPQGAQLDIHRNFKDEIGSSFFSSRGMMSQNVAGFLARNGINASRTIRLEEYCIKPEYPLFVFGTLGENSNSLQWTPGAHIISTHKSLNFQFSIAGPFAASILQALGGLPGASGDSIPGAIALAAPMGAVAQAQTQTQPQPPPASSSWSAVSIDEVALARGRNQGAASNPPGPGPSSQVFPAAQPQPSAVATATPDGIAPDPKPGPAPASEGAGQLLSVAISKGIRNEPFIISWQSQREFVQSLAWKSTACIWGGPALTVVCLYVLSLTLGWT